MSTQRKVPGAVVISPYLVQRGKLRAEPRADRKGIDALVSWDYMGSAEFECGGLFQSLKRIRTAAQLTQHKTPFRAHDGRGLFLLCPVDAAPYQEALAALARDEVRTKETHYLAQTLAGHDARFRNRGLIYKVDLWWDIEHDWIAILGKRSAEGVLAVILG